MKNIFAALTVLMKPLSPIYLSLSRFRILSRSYSLKFLFIAFLGIHIPLIGIILYLLFGPAQLQPLPIFLIVLALTLAATAVTLFLLNGLLYPLMQSKMALERYLDERKLPDLPQQYTDEAGILMKKVQQTIMALNTMLEEKRDLAALLSHDLKQPLSIIGTTADAISTTSDPETIRKFSGNISKMVKDQFSLMEDVLELLKYDVIDNSKDQHTTLPVENFMEDVIDGAQMQASLKNITIQCHFDYDGLITVNMELFRQVIKNLLHNAIKFSYRGGTIQLQVQQEGDDVQISVIDSGKGFRPEIKEKLFQRFTSEGQKGTADEPSTGIGLHICKKIVELHHGSIDAASKGPETGARFTVKIPAELAA